MFGGLIIVFITSIPFLFDVFLLDFPNPPLVILAIATIGLCSGYIYASKRRHYSRNKAGKHLRKKKVRRMLIIVSLTTIASTLLLLFISISIDRIYKNNLVEKQGEVVKQELLRNFKDFQIETMSFERGKKGILMPGTFDKYTFNISSEDYVCESTKEIIYQDRDYNEKTNNYIMHKLYDGDFEDIYNYNSTYLELSSNSRKEMIEIIKKHRCNYARIKVVPSNDNLLRDLIWKDYVSYDLENNPDRKLWYYYTIDFYPAWGAPARDYYLYYKENDDWILIKNLVLTDSGYVEP